MEVKLDGTSGSALIAFAVAAIGSFLPWATVGPLLHINGTSVDGQITLPVAIVGALLILGRQPALALLAALVVGGVGIYDALNLADKASQVNAAYAANAGVSIGVGFGLIMVAVSGGVAFIACLGMTSSTGSVTQPIAVEAAEAPAPILKPEMGKCSNCGWQIRSDAEQCYHCGIIFRAPPERV